MVVDMEQVTGSLSFSFFSTVALYGFLVDGGREFLKSPMQYGG
jgi:hypothetical protein